MIFIYFLTDFGQCLSTFRICFQHLGNVFQHLGYISEKEITVSISYYIVDDLTESAVRSSRDVNMEHLGQSSYLNEEVMKSKQQKANVAAEKASMY